MNKKKTSTASSLVATNAAALARTVDEALAILAESMGENDHALPAVSAPLPSILERCEDALARSHETEAPLRLLQTFAGMDDGGCALLLAKIPNVKLLPARLLRGEFGDSLYAGAEDAALLHLLLGYEARGWLPVLRRVHGLDSAEGGARAVRGLGNSAVEGRTIRALMPVRHPLLSYYGAQENGQFNHRSVSLEAYSRACLTFLDAHEGTPRLPMERVVAEPDWAAEYIADIFGFSFPADLAEQLQMDREDIFSFAWLRGAEAASSAALRILEAPDDRPAYDLLCDRLGYDATRLPDPRPTVSIEPMLLRPLPPRRGDSRLASFLPRLARVTDVEAHGMWEDGADPAKRESMDAVALVELAEECLSQIDCFYERLDSHLSSLSSRDAALLLICCAAHFSNSGQSLHALALLAEAEELTQTADRPLRLLSAGLLLGLRRPELALATLTADAVRGAYQLESQPQEALRNALALVAPSAAGEHGQALLLDHLHKTPPKPIDRRRVMIEIGTTREHVPGQGSTEKLARLCLDLGLDFITVDMDPRNSTVARRMFRQIGAPFRAVTAKGEDFLAEWEGIIDYCFLDAYDFDHGQHSDLRQSRYETFLGSRISDDACHKMHLDCAGSLAEKLAIDGLICFDDTWTDEQGEWTAKGKTAMPYLLRNGFHVVDARNRAALLARD